MMDDFIAQGLTALLSDPDAKRIVLAYLQNIADAAKPQPQQDNWKTVWEALSEELREINGKLGCLHLETHYDERASVAVVTARVRPAQFTLTMPRWERAQLTANDVFYSWGELVYHATFAARHYTDAILIGQQAMGEAVAAWDKKLKGDE